MKAQNYIGFLIGCICLISIPIFSQSLFEEHIILENFQGATCIASADFDADGDFDFVVTANDGNKVSWFKNDGMQNFTEQVVITGFTKAKTVLAARIDNNNSFDIVASAKTLGRFSWFSNDGSGNFTEHIITDSSWTSADFACAADIDRDGDNDLVLVACDNHKIAWADNDGNGNFIIHMLKENWNKANWATVADMDDDQDMDVIATAKAGQILWFRNDGWQNFTEQVLADSIPGLNSVQVADLDGDTDPDMVATACDVSDQVDWFENDGAFGFTRHLLRDHYNGARASKIADMDKDGDTDILSIARQSGFVHLWENDGSGFFTERLVSDKAYDMIQVCVTDLDLDSDPDILGACYADHETRWWESINTFLVPDFSADSLTGHGSLHISFTDLSYGKPEIKSWQWDFNNDGTVDSYLRHPQWFIDVPGSYTVRLVVSSDSITDTLVKKDYIRIFDGESSLEFNGTNSRVKCNNDSIINLTGCFTMEAWIKPASYGESGTGRIFDKTMISLYVYASGPLVPEDSCVVLTMAHTNGTVSVVCTPGGSVKMNTWQHIAFTYNDTLNDVHLFLDGTDQPLVMVTPPEGKLVNNESREIILGNNRNNNQGFQGCIDELRLWTTIRTPEELAHWMPLNLPPEQTCLSGYWKMNEGIGDTTDDHSGCGHHGLLNGAKWAQGVDLISIGINDPQPVNNSSETPVFWYPNPCHGRLTVGSHRDWVTVYLTDTRGRILERFQLKKESCCIIDLSSYSEGVYFLRSQVDGISYSGKFILAR